MSLAMVQLTKSGQLKSVTGSKAKHLAAANGKKKNEKQTEKCFQPKTVTVLAQPIDPHLLGPLLPKVVPILKCKVNEKKYNKRVCKHSQGEGKVVLFGFIYNAADLDKQ